MKHLSKIIFALVLVTGLYSCSSDDDNSSGNNQQLYTELYKKWIVQDNSASSKSGVTTFTVNADMIESIEFTDNGMFIIIETTGNITFGTYTITNNGSTLDLGEEGTILIDNLDESSFSFTFQVSTNTISLFAEPAAEIETNTTNEAFFQYWTVQNLAEYNATSEDVDSQYSELNILFTPYGSYLVNGTKINGDAYTELSYWKWKNEAQTEVCFKYEEDEDFNCDEDFFEINSLSESQFVFTDTPNEDPFQYTLTPVN